ncbi:MAG: alpha-L-fucosidase, partial [Clostridia bacterium]|nr:alpha-L-fucosidase [Clostridia bacterium]
MEFKEFLKSAAAVKPSERQMNWFDTEFYAFVHFTVNTYTALEWGLGNEDPAIFNPSDLNCDDWVEAVKSAGMKGLVLTAKHHDGFCLWPSAYTDHSVKSSPWKDGKGDVVRECAEACARGGIKFGVYLSPWDRNSKYYGTDAYNDYYCNQLTELLTNYGELFMVWFDGACGEGPNGKKQTYDFDRYIALIRKYQPNACIFNDFGPDVRWCGNEAGQARRAEWAVVPTDFCYR